MDLLHNELGQALNTFIGSCEGSTFCEVWYKSNKENGLTVRVACAQTITENLILKVKRWREWLVMSYQIL